MTSKSEKYDKIKERLGGTNSGSFTFSQHMSFLRELFESDDTVEIEAPVEVAPPEVVTVEVPTTATYLLAQLPDGVFILKRATSDIYTPFAQMYETQVARTMIKQLTAAWEEAHRADSAKKA
jgi:hypothetical protein